MDLTCERPFRNNSSGYHAGKRLSHNASRQCDGAGLCRDSRTGRRLGIEFILTIFQTVIDGAHELSRAVRARLSGLYSCPEIGVIALECPATPRYHVIAENALVEIVDHNSHDVTPGSFGRIIVTGAYTTRCPSIAMRLEMCDRRQRCVSLRANITCYRASGGTNAHGIHLPGRQARLAAGMGRSSACDLHALPQVSDRADRPSADRVRYVPDGSGASPDNVSLTALARQIMHPSMTMLPWPWTRYRVDRAGNSSRSSRWSPPKPREPASGMTNWAAETATVS